MNLNMYGSCIHCQLLSKWNIIIIMYLYSAQYLHILQDSKRYLTNPTVQVQYNISALSVRTLFVVTDLFIQFAH